jgi:hypothetical protein
MKSSRWIFLTLVATGATHPVAAGPERAMAGSLIQVEFVKPEKFSDFKADAAGSPKGRDNYLGQLKGYLMQQAGGQLPQGQRLSVSITNIDMAGEFEPWRGQSLANVRVVKDQYPPRIDLSFKLTDAQGKLLREGSSELRNLSFMTNANINRQDPLRHEKKLLDDWLRRELAGKK